MTTTLRAARSIRVRVIREPGFTRMSPRKSQICWDFGVPPREPPITLAEDLRIQLRPGAIVLLTGPSGSGKSSILAEITTEAGCFHPVEHARFPRERGVVDAVAPRGKLRAALEILTACGLGEPRLWLRPFDDLSAGEKFRAALARAIGRSIGDGDRPPIVCDEFSANLHRRAARAIAHNLRKLVTRLGLTLVLATTHDDIADDLQPDQWIRLGGETADVRDFAPGTRMFSLLRRAVIEPGTIADYRRFAPMHYRHRDGLGFVDKVFLLRDAADPEPLGIVVYAHAPRELALRNRATAGRFVNNLRRLNRDLRILRRLVIHPDVRGCGLGYWLVRCTLPRVGVRFVECLAAMGSVNPVFERAGMTRVGRCPPPRGRLAMLEKLRRWKVDPFADEFPSRIARYPRIRRLVERTLHHWISLSHAGRRFDFAARSNSALAAYFRQLVGEPPMYYLWDRDGRFPEPPAEGASPKTNPARKPTRRARIPRDRHNPRRDQALGTED